MTAREEWSVLTKSVPATAATPTARQLEQLASQLPGADAWAQYPPASGRGHGLETRFWVEAEDAADAAAIGCQLVEAAQASAGLADWTIVRLHSASLDERALEFYPGLERRSENLAEWSIMLRAALAAPAAPLTDDERASLRRVLGGADAYVGGAGNTIELRFWVRSSDAVDAAAVAEATAAAALRAIGRSISTTVRLQSASVAERNREAYRGVERRLAGG